jgi:hypothetical protein
MSVLSASNPMIWRTLAPRNKPNQLALCGSTRSSPPVEANNCPRPGFRPPGSTRSSPPVEANNCPRPGFRPRVPVSVPKPILIHRVVPCGRYIGA